MSKSLQLRLIALAGLLLFVPLFIATFASPIEVERAARGYIESKIKHRIEDMLDVRIDEARDTTLGRLAEKLASKNKEKIEALRERLSSGLNERIAAVGARMQDLSCECRNLLLKGLNAIAAAQISALEDIAPQLQQIIEGNYAQIVTSLMLDVRIFAGTNAAAFLVLLLLSFTRQDRMRQLFIPAILLAVATVVGCLIYVFGQNWFFTILHADYMGWTYSFWTLVIFGLLADIALFKARVTTRILNQFVSAASNAVPSC